MLQLLQHVIYKICTGLDTFSLPYITMQSKASTTWLSRLLKYSITCYNDAFIFVTIRLFICHIFHPYYHFVHTRINTIIPTALKLLAEKIDKIHTKKQTDFSTNQKFEKSASFFFLTSWHSTNASYIHYYFSRGSNINCYWYICLLKNNPKILIACMKL